MKACMLSVLLRLKIQTQMPELHRRCMMEIGVDGSIVRINAVCPTSKFRHMSRSIKIILAGLVIILILIIGWLAIFRSSNPVPSGSNLSEPISFPNAGADGRLLIQLASGGSLQVPNFTQINQPPIAGPQTGYQVAGASESAYQILFFPEDSYFLISLFEEPLGETRRAAETELQNTLKLSQQELCMLNSDVFTTIDVNEQYAGQDLGLSFCQQSVPLPQ